MFSDIDAAATLDRVAWVLDARRLESDEIHKLLYYAQGISYALDGASLFEGRFLASSHGPLSEGFECIVRDGSVRWWDALRQRTRDMPDAFVDRLKDVYEGLGVLGQLGLSRATRAERPWQRARYGLTWRDQSVPPISDVHIRDYFTYTLETGEDAVNDLDIPVDPVEAPWLKQFKVAVNVSYNSRHPFFVESEAVNLRQKLGFSAVPDDWTGFFPDDGETGREAMLNQGHG